MNYLILTPDSVGSTLLQRLMTVSLWLAGVSVRNTNELTNGIYLKDGIATKDHSLLYTQQLDQISDTLDNSSKQTLLISRLSKYHMDNRKDHGKEQEKFMKHLDGFFAKKIVCVRKNIFEYAMSWSIRKKSNVLNVYTQADREKTSLVKKVDEDFFLSKCQEYVDYKYWTEKHFANTTEVWYEDLVTDTDKVIGNLVGHIDVFKKHLGSEISRVLRNEYKFHSSLLSADKVIKLSRQEQKSLFLYKKTINNIVDDESINNCPIKNTTLRDKKDQIKNFEHCLDKFYSFARNHNWIDQSTATYDFWNKEHIC